MYRGSRIYGADRRNSGKFRNFSRLPAVIVSTTLGRVNGADSADGGVRYAYSVNKKEIQDE
jgi:hypothetical protein